MSPQPAARPELKILLVIDGLWVGGAERALVELLPYLIQAKIEPVIACFYRYLEEGVEQEVLSQGFEVRFLNNASLRTRVQSLRQVIKAERPQLIHTALFKANMAGRLAALGQPVTMLNSLTNTPYPPVRFQDPRIKPIRLKLLQWLDAWTARRLVTHFHAVSEAVKTAAIETMGLPPERITVVKRGRDAARLGRPSLERRQQARQKLGLKAEDRVLVNVGRHEYQKGQRDLLAALTVLAPKHPTLMLLIAGREGHATTELKRFRAEAGLEQHVRLLGHRSDVPQILAAADQFVFPSLYEGLPGAVLEAMALGLPIVASNIAPVQEVVEAGRNAWLVEPASPAALAQAIEALLDDEARAAAFGRRSREIFEQHFTLEQSASRMIELYYQLAAGNHGSRAAV
jgi:glycosyltransferase involved in cell wall biosynthesis